MLPTQRMNNLVQEPSETVFLFPWALRYQQLGWFGVAEATVFLGLLAVGYVWAWKKGALDWA